MQRASSVDGLTWHQGSVLPFASLWHTVMRAAVLNALRVRELPYALTASGAKVAPELLAIDLVFNESDRIRRAAIAVPTLAKWLGEAEGAFVWSHLGGVMPDLRFVLAPGLRWCPECLAGGYHSVLFSVRLLEDCPIHGCRLLDACPCGRPLESQLSAGLLARGGACECGNFALLTQATCRRPTMPREDTAALQPVVDWLEKLSHVGMPRFNDATAHRAGESRWFEQVRDWCDLLDLGYPNCFVDRPRHASLRTVVTLGTPARPSPASERRRSRQGGAHEDHWPEPDGYWYENPATWAYRGWLRYLRRHVAREAESFARAFLEKPDPLEMAQAMSQSPTAKVAFAEMVLCLRLEREVLSRRWPYRRMVQRTDGRLICCIEVARASPALDGQGQVVEPLSSWSEYQACRSLLLSHWREAQRLAEQAVRTGLADWRSTAAADEHGWSTLAGVDGIRFASLELQAAHDWALPLPDKVGRAAAYHQGMVRRLQDIKDACRGPILTRRPNGEWAVVESLPPSRARVDSLRLLGVGSHRPKFWLYQTDGGFVARACQFRLQALADRPAEAIEGLRQIFLRYAQRYPIRQDVPASTRLGSRQRARDKQRADYEHAIYWVRQDMGFWRGAEFFLRAAKAYRHFNAGESQPGALGSDGLAVHVNPPLTIKGCRIAATRRHRWSQ